MTGFAFGIRGEGRRKGRPRYSTSLAAALALLAVGILPGCSTPGVRFGYVATGEGIYAFRVDAVTGAATVVVGSPYVAKTNPTSATSTSSVAVYPSNRFLFATNQDTNNI
jgi:hypothetical protein